MKKNLVPLLGIALIVAVAATGIFYGLFVSRLRSTSGRTGPRVVVASKAISRGHRLTEADLRLVEWGSDALPKGAFTDGKAAVGLTAVQAMAENEPLLESRVASKEGTSRGGLGIPAGMRAVAIQVADARGLAEMLGEGQRVDVQLVSPVGQPAEIRTILQNVEILRVAPAPDPRTPPSITLLVTPEQADAVSLGDSTARLRVLLRNPLDEEMPATSRLTLGPIFENPPKAAVRPEGGSSGTVTAAAGSRP